MLQYIFKKIAQSFLVLFGVASVLFFLFQLLPGDPALIILGQKVNKASVEAVNQDLGTNLPLAIQYAKYINDLSIISIYNNADVKHAFYFNAKKISIYTSFKLFDSFILVFKPPYLRQSYISKRPVNHILKETIPTTFILATSSMFLACVIGISFGILCALYKKSWFDKICLSLSSVGISAPSFFVGLIIAWIFAYILKDYTNLSPTGSLFNIDVWHGKTLCLKNVLLPTLTLGIRPLATLIQLTRESLIDVLNKEYILTAKAKGLSTFQILFKQALKNAIAPVITSISGWFASLLAGAVFVEYIFNWKGIGFEVFEALSKNDLPVVMGATLFFAFMFTIINVCVDFIYCLLDPRITLK